MSRIEELDQIIEYLEDTIDKTKKENEKKKILIEDINLVLASIQKN